MPFAARRPDVCGENRPRRCRLDFLRASIGPLKALTLVGMPDQSAAPSYARGHRSHRVSARLIRWFRTNRHFGARLALVAVALQLVLTFGHVHIRAAAVASAIEASHASHTAPLSPGHSGPGDSNCPVCTLIQLSAISAPSVAPELPLPIAIDLVTLQPGNMLAVRIALPASFQARAPPVA